MHSARMNHCCRPVPSALLICLLAVGLVQAQTTSGGSRFGKTDNRSQYVHHIQLLDVNKKTIDPDDPKAPPYSSVHTCGKCHDYKAIAHGWHFNAFEAGAESGRPGEPWLWTDERIGTQIPLAGRGWKGTYKPDDLGLKPYRFTQLFGRHFPGGGAGERAAAEPDNPRWKAAGELAVDCMACHARDHSWSHSVWMEQVEDENFAWASTAALGLGKIEGAVKSLPRDFDPAKPPAGKSLPVVKYYKQKFDADKNVFLDIIRKPSSNACYQCHTVNHVGPNAQPKWNTDQDVHLKAGMQCADCHRNDINHSTSRGYLGEKNPTAPSVATLSCKGCHYGSDGSAVSGAGDGRNALGGRLGSPQPRHTGIPALHFEKLACTTCHAGPVPAADAQPMQSSKAHKLGVKSQTRLFDDAPGILAPVFLVDPVDGQITPHRVVWPAFWGRMKGDKITPIDPEVAYGVLRSTLRIRKDFRRELVAGVKLTGDETAALIGKERAAVGESKMTDEEKAKIAEARQAKAAVEFRKTLLPKALAELAKADKDATPVYISGGKAWKLTADGRQVETFYTPAADPYGWAIGHDVRPARQSMGVKGCVECHTPTSDIFYSTAAAVGPAPDDRPPKIGLIASAGLDGDLLKAWEQSFQGHKVFKVVASISFTILCGILLIYGLQGLAGISKWIFGRGK